MFGTRFFQFFICLILQVTASFALLKDQPADHRNFKSDTTIRFNSTVVTEGGWTYYSQCDANWAKQRLGFCDGYTICSAGCAMTSAAMLLSTKGINVNPGSLDEWLGDNGGYWDGCDIIWSTIDKFGVTAFQGLETAAEPEICNGLSQGHGIIANVNNGGHWVLLTGCLGNGVFSVNDPGYSRTTYSMGEIVMEAVYH